MLRERFPDLLPHLSAGLFGRGSECFGYDDATSQDHDFEPGFMLLLPDEDVLDRRTAFLLERAYAKLPRAFMGLRRSLTTPVGGARRGVLRLSEVLSDLIGSSDGCLSLGQWLSLPEHALAEAVNGEVFYDGNGALGHIRAGLAYYPEDVRRKKLAGQLLLMAQAGQYNYGRCLKHGETGAAQLACIDFARSAMHVIFLLNRVYMPYYKWSFRAMRALPELDLLAELLEYLISTDNESAMAEAKQDVIEGICSDVIDALKRQALSSVDHDDLEKHAYSVNDGIADAALRNAHVLSAV